MARMTGTMLKLARMATSAGPGRSIAARRMRAAYNVDEWADLPDAARDGFETNDRPVAGGAPRDWGAADVESRDLDVPSLRAGTAADWRELYEQGDVTPVDLVEALRGRIESAEFGEALYSPFASHDWERALEQAEASAERWATGESISPLDGVPVPIKDHHRVEGLPTTNGTSFFAENEGEATWDSELVRRLDEAGAIIIGKSLTTEWGLQPTGFSAHFEMPRNPYDRDHAAGGSSTGTGVAVALGFAPVGHGTDGGGSIRIPSAVNGIAGLKPTFQRVSRVGDLWGDSTLSHNGCLGRSTADLVDFLEVAAAEPDENDPATIPPDEVGEGEATGVEAWRAALTRGIDGATIGVWSRGMEAAHDRMTDPVWNALDELESEGAEIREVDIEFAEHHGGVGTMTFGAEFLGLLAEIIDDNIGQTGDDIRLMYNVFETIGLREYMQARRMRDVLRNNMAETLATVDVLAMPTTGMPAPAYPDSQTGRAVYDEEAVAKLCQFAFLMNLTGLPAGTIPCGRVDGLPVGLQFVGDAWDEASVIAAMAHCERCGVADIVEPDDFVAPGELIG